MIPFLKITGVPAIGGLPTSRGETPISKQKASDPFQIDMVSLRDCLTSPRLRHFEADLPPESTPEKADCLRSKTRNQALAGITVHYKFILTNAAA